MTSAVKQPPVARDKKEWHRLRASVEITDLLKEEVFADRSAYSALSAVLNNTRQTNSATQLLYPYVRCLPNRVVTLLENKLISNYFLLI